MATDAENIQSAFDDVLEIGQSVQHDGTNFKFPDIDKLYNIKKDIATESARSTTRPLCRRFNFQSMGY
jgi:hypothetical protein